MSNKTIIEFQDILKNATVPVPVKSDRNDLWRLCLENGLLEREFKKQTDVTVVKSSLQNAMTLNNEDFKALSNRIDKYVEIVSKMLRRSSLVFYDHILRLEEKRAIIPDFYKMNDTYWKNWLKIGLQKDFPDKESEKTYNIVEHLFADPFLTAAIKEVKYFDQILCFAATTFKTAIANNAWYPMFDKLTRLVGLKLDEYDEKNMKKYQVIKQIRSRADDLDIFIPHKVLTFVNEARGILCIKDNTTFIDDKHGKEDMTFSEAFKYNMWLQTHFQSMEAKMSKLSPVFSVNRAHIRLDVKTLTFLFKDLFPENAHVKRYNKFCSSMNSEGHPEKPITLKRKDCAKDEWDVYQASLLIYKEAMKEYKLKQQFKEKSKAPQKLMLKTVVRPTELKKKKCTKDQWEEYQRQLVDYRDAIEEIKASEEYLKFDAIHQKHEKEQKRMIASFFTKIRKRNWSFDCSIQTDGVAVSRQFTRTINVEKKPLPKDQEPVRVDEYNRNLSCFIEAINTLVIGLDPGRVNLACLSYIWIKDNGEVEKKSWSLTRGKYYNDSGIRIRASKKTKRFEKLAESWTGLGTLRATKSLEIENYVEKYNLIKDEWWRLALKKTEARATLDNYSGKKKVLHSFFADVKKNVQKQHPGVKIVVAYGSATISPTGRGEVSAPIGDTYKTCCEHFETQKQDESFSTKKSFLTGNDMEKVYKTFRYDDGTIHESFGHCPMSVNVSAKRKEDQDLLDAYNDAKKKKKKPGGESIDLAQLKKNEKRRFHFPVIRGLQFCPETCMYVDRDLKASLTIARLAVMRIVGNERPRAFTREIKE